MAPRAVQWRVSWRGASGWSAGEVLEVVEEATLVYQRVEEVALRLEVVVDGGVGDSGLAGNVADGRAREAALGEEAERGVEDLLAGMRTTPRALGIAGVRNRGFRGHSLYTLHGET